MNECLVSDKLGKLHRVKEYDYNFVFHDVFNFNLMFFTNNKITKHILKLDRQK